MNDEMIKLWYLTRTGVSRKRRIRYYAENGLSEMNPGKISNNRDLKYYFTEEECRMFTNPSAQKQTEDLALYMKQNNIRFVFYGDPAYPRDLINIPDPPCGLFYLGHLPSENMFRVSVVGARMCTEYGRRISQELGRRLAECGIGVVSGMAMGVDSASHDGALQADGRTYAVLGSGCDVCYPASSGNIYRQIVQSGGVISEYLPQTKPTPWRFPERNRLISGLADVLVVAEAKEKSGSLITVDCALDQGKDIYAVPGRLGDRTSAGCNRLIEQGASVVYDLDRFIQEMKEKAAEKERVLWRPAAAAPGPAEKPPLEKEDQLVYSCLDLHPKNVMLILEETGLMLEPLLTSLERLTAGGWVVEAQRNAYIRSTVDSDL